MINKGDVIVNNQALDNETLVASEKKYSQEELDKELNRLKAIYTNQEYMRKRAEEYPDWGTQLDYIYHNGIDKWKTDMVDPIKNKYPKPE